MNQQKLTTFQNLIWDYYAQHKRIFPWRNVDNPYFILVSEIMLQQTQTYRVITKYAQFIQQFPTITSLAQAPQADVIKAWQGLGYNRRALALHRTAQHIVNDYKEMLPRSPEILETFPGIGKATAASICAFAFNLPTIFIETNIRAVFIYHFFAHHNKVSDKELLPLITATVDQENPREWYYALMDYGVMLKKIMINPSRLSAHHTKQTHFEGSDRQIRGMILKVLTQKSCVNFEQLCCLIPREHHRVEKAMQELCKEGFIKQEATFFTLA